MSVCNNFRNIYYYVLILEPCDCIMPTTKSYKKIDSSHSKSVLMLNLKPSRRNNLDIAAQILIIAKNGCLKTQIMYKGNLSFTQLNEYIAFMKNNNLLAQTKVEGKDIYTVTEKGLDFLQRYHQLNQMLETPSGRKPKTATKIL
jgi:predicted transcriptional regulator